MTTNTSTHRGPGYKGWFLFGTPGTPTASYSSVGAALQFGFVARGAEPDTIVLHTGQTLSAAEAERQGIADAEALSIIAGRSGSTVAAPVTRDDHPHSEDAKATQAAATVAQAQGTVEGALLAAVKALHAASASPEADAKFLAAVRAVVGRAA